MTEIIGTSGDDVIVGTSEADVIAPGSGNDNTRAGEGDDQVNDAEGDDVIDGEGGNDRIDGGGGDDILRGGTGNDNLVGNIGNDALHGGDGGDNLFGIGGVDLIFGDGGDDFIDGGDGNDVIRGGPGNDQASGGDGNDEIYGGDGDDILAGLAGTDQLFGESGNDRLGISGTSRDILRADGGAGEDLFEIRGNNDFIATIDGGADNDIFEIATRQGRYDITMGAGEDTIRPTNLAAIFDNLPGPRLTVTVTDFVAGDGGDRFELAGWLSGLTDWPSHTNPFVSGFLRLVQTGSDALVQAKQLVNGEFVTLATLRNVTASNLTAHNFAGLAPDGSPPPVNRIETTPGSDAVMGTSGNDLFIASIGQDNLRGGDGYDRIIFDFQGLSDPVRGLLRSSSFDIEGWFIGPAQGNETRTFEIEDIEFRGGSGDDGFDVRLSGVRGSWRVLLDGGAGQDSVTIDVNSTSIAVSNDPQLIIENGINLRNFEIYDLRLGNGNDRIILGSASANIEGNDGDDVLTGGVQDDSLAGGGGTDVLSGGGGNDILVSGGAPGDTLDRGLESDILTGDSGNDLLIFSLNDNADGGAGTDSFSIDLRPFGSAVTIDFSGLAIGGVVTNGSGSLRNFESYRMILGTDFNDVINVGDLSQPVREINSTQRGVSGLDGDDILIAGSANNALYGGNGNDRIVAGGGDDFASGDLGRDLIYGEDGNDLLQGDDGDDGLDGGRGNDELDGGAGEDVMIGGLGNDVFKVENANDIVAELAGEGTDTVAAMISYYLGANVENLTLAAFSSNHFGVGNDLANVLTGNFGENLLIGGGGNDIARGGDSRDALFGESGDDQLFGDFGVDYIVGGTGNDSIDGGVDADEIYGQDGDDVLNGGLGFHTDIIVGGDGNDVLRGSTGQGDFDFLYGNAGNDSFYVDTPADLVFEQTGEGTDTVFADIIGAGFYLYDNIENLTLLGNTPFGVGNGLANTITGNAQGNFLLGGAGNDVLNGMGGGDVLFGEAGADLFVFGRGTGADVIGDFQRGVDRIDLTAFGIGSFAALQAMFVQDGNIGAILLGNGDLVVLHGVQMGQLVASDFTI